MKASIKGSRAERELLDKFHALGYRGIRIAGSGHSHGAPDLLVGLTNRVLVIECKASGKNCVYIDPLEIQNVLDYSIKFNGEGWYGIRFDRKDWIFFRAEEIANNRKVSPDTGLSFQKLIQATDLFNK